MIKLHFLYHCNSIFSLQVASTSIILYTKAPDGKLYNLFSSMHHMTIFSEWVEYCSAANAIQGLLDIWRTFYNIWAEMGKISK